MSAHANPGTPIQGVTLYSFTRFFHGRQMDLPEMIREVARRGLGPGLEIVGFQSIRNFPDVSEEFVREWRETIDETGLVPTALGANADAGLRRDRRLTNDELVEYMERQLSVASRLGFPIVRVQFSLTPDDMERLLPVAERLGVTLGLEIHAHHSAKHPLMQDLLERFEKLGSPRLGFIPDWGATMRRLPRTLLEKYLRRGVDPVLVGEIDAYWDKKLIDGAVLNDHVQEERFAEIVELAHRHGHPELAIELAVNATALFGHADPESWREIMPWSVHTHGKFYEIAGDGEDPSVPIPEIMGIYIDEGYSRTISTEWEGFHWNDWDSAFDVIGRQQALLRKTAFEKSSRMVVDPDEARALMASYLG